VTGLARDRSADDYPQGPASARSRGAVLFPTPGGPTEQPVLPVAPRRRSLKRVGFAAGLALVGAGAVVAVAIRSPVPEPMPGLESVQSGYLPPDAGIAAPNRSPYMPPPLARTLHPPDADIPAPSSSAYLPPPRASTLPPAGRATRRPVRRETIPRAPARAAPVLAGRLFVNSFPWGHVYVDGDSLGDTPLANVAIAPGTHTVLITRPGYRPLERSVVVASGDSVWLVSLRLAAEM